MEAQQEQEQVNENPSSNENEENASDSSERDASINVNELQFNLTDNELNQFNQDFSDYLTSALISPDTPSTPSSWSSSPDNLYSRSPLSTWSTGSGDILAPSPQWPWQPTLYNLPSLPNHPNIIQNPFTRSLDLTRDYHHSVNSTAALPIISSYFNENHSLPEPCPNDNTYSIQSALTDHIRGLKTIGPKITYYQADLIGLGCMGTKVYKGILGGTKSIAVKRIDLDFCKYFANEVALLNATNGHPNIINYHCTEIDGECRYIALELCDGSLFDYVQQNEKGRRIGIADPIEILHQCTQGLSYIHSKNIVHRDLKPSNILLRKVGENVIAKITDFGLGKTIDEGAQSYTNSGNDTGTQGWKAPEVGPIPEGPRMTSKVDIFALGCIYHYVLTNGVHPFGDLADRTSVQYKIRSGNHINLGIPDDTRGITKLIKAMIALNPLRRPPVTGILYHPMFWSDDKILAFYQEVRSLFNTRNFDVSATTAQLEAGRHRVFQGNWLDRISNEFRNVLMARRNYNGALIKDLIKAFRDKYVHYDEIPLRARMEIGEKNEYIAYWLGLFPELLPYTWETFETLKLIPNFSHGSFYSADFDFFPLLVDDVEGNNMIP